MTTTRTKRGICDYSKSNAKHSLARVLAAITAAPCMPAELRARLHLAERSLSRHLAHLRGHGQVPSERLIRVASWYLVRSVYHPVFALGNAPDAIKPKQTEKQRYAKWKAHKARNPELRERAHQREATRWAEKKAKRRQNTWVAPIPQGPSTFATPKVVAKIDRLLSVMDDLQLSTYQLAERAGMSYGTIKNYVRHLHRQDAPKRLYVARWERSKADYVRFYAVGDLPDAPRPQRIR